MPKFQFAIENICFTLEDLISLFSAIEVAQSNPNEQVDVKGAMSIFIKSLMAETEKLKAVMEAMFEASRSAREEKAA